MCLNGGVCNNGVCVCPKQYTGNVCQFLAEGVEEANLQSGLESTSSFSTFFLIMVVLILVLLGVAIYLQRNMSKQPRKEDSES
jgi:F0F1-type ATP synthase membrane subunit a